MNKYYDYIVSEIACLSHYVEINDPVGVEIKTTVILCDIGFCREMQLIDGRLCDLLKDTMTRVLIPEYKEESDASC